MCLKEVYQLVTDQPAGKNKVANLKMNNKTNRIMNNKKIILSIT